MVNRSTPDLHKSANDARPQIFEAQYTDDSTDAQDSGEPATAGNAPESHLGGDIGFDRIVGPEEAGLGGGLDQAEEARLGVTDEELAEMARQRLGLTE